MAKPIQPTPTLEGKDAENFFRELDRVKTKEEVLKRKEFFGESDRIFRTFGKNLIRKMVS